MNECLIGDCRELLPTLPNESVHCVVTSPPYWGLRDYGVAGQLGLESTPQEYVENMVAVFREVRRVLRDDATLWLNLGDTYGTGTTAARTPGNRGIGADQQLAQDAVPRAGGMAKQMIGIPWRVAFALQADGWYLRQDIIWSKPNPVPESVRDRCTKAHEYLFLLAKNEHYYFDADAIAEPAIYVGLTGQDENGFKNPLRFNGKLARSDKQRGHSRRHAGFNGRWDEMTRLEQCSGTRNKRDVWNIATAPFAEAHFATFPPALIEPCILAGCPSGGTVLDLFMGSGTVAQVAQDLGRQWIGIELNPLYGEMVQKRSAQAGIVFA